MFGIAEKPRRERLTVAKTQLKAESLLRGRWHGFQLQVVQVQTKLAGCQL